MNSGPAQSVTLDASDFDALFPFHVGIGPDGIITRLGRSLRKIAPSLQPGDSFERAFAPKRPAAPLEVARLRAGTGALYTLRERTSGTVFRGQMQVLDDGVVFLGTPWLGDTRELETLKLTLNDFAIHDPTLDLLQILQVQRIATEDLHLLAERLRQQGAELESGARMKDTFLASMSHELRTPLVGILGLTESMIEGVAGALNPKQESYLRIIEGSGRRLLNLVNDILDLAKIEAGQEKLTKTLCSVAEICAASAQSVRPLVEKRRQILLVEDLPPGLRMQVDARRIKQALDNLLENASKFTREEGRLGLRVRVQGSVLRFEVWDEGIGIAEADLPSLFRPFVQLDGRLARRYDGSGLGLALVKQLVQLHAGEVFVTSALGLGSQFAFEIPSGLTDSVEQPPAPQSAGSEAATVGA